MQKKYKPIVESLHIHLSFYEKKAHSKMGTTNDSYTHRNMTQCKPIELGTQPKHQMTHLVKAEVCATTTNAAQL